MSKDTPETKRLLANISKLHRQIGAAAKLRPAPRRKVRTVRAWAVVTREGEIWSLERTRKDAAQYGARHDFIVKLSGEYTPKNKGAKR